MSDVGKVFWERALRYHVHRIARLEVARIEAHGNVYRGANARKIEGEIEVHEMVRRAETALDHGTCEKSDGENECIDLRGHAGSCCMVRR